MIYTISIGALGLGVLLTLFGVFMFFKGNCFSVIKEIKSQNYTTLEREDDEITRDIYYSNQFVEPVEEKPVFRKANKVKAQNDTSMLVENQYKATEPLEAFKTQNEENLFSGSKNTEPLQDVPPLGKNTQPLSLDKNTQPLNPPKSQNTEPLFKESASTEPLFENNASRNTEALDKPINQKFEIDESMFDEEIPLEFQD